MKKPRTLVGLIYAFMKFSMLQILLAIMFTGLVLGASEDSYGQTVLDEVISLRVENRKVKHVLDVIEASIETKYAYNPQSIPIGEKVSLVVENSKLAYVLYRLLTPLNVTFEVSGDYIILSRRHLVLL